MNNQRQPGRWDDGSYPNWGSEVSNEEIGNGQNNPDGSRQNPYLDLLATQQNLQYFQQRDGGCEQPHTSQQMPIDQLVEISGLAAATQNLQSLRHLSQQVSNLPNQNLSTTADYREQPSAALMNDNDTNANNTTLSRQVPILDGPLVPPHITLSQQLPAQNRSTQELLDQNLPISTMRQPSVSTGHFFGPPSISGVLTRPSTASGNFASQTAKNDDTPTAFTAGALVFPCRSRGMPDDHNAQVSCAANFDIYGTRHRGY